jgi:hypothetical protein
MPDPVVHLMVAKLGPVFVGCCQRDLYRGSRSRITPLSNKKLYMRSTGDRYTKRYLGKKVQSHSTYQLKKLKYRRGQGQLASSGSWLGSLVPVRLRPGETRMGLDRCQHISPSPPRQGHGECRRDPGLVSTPDFPLWSAPVSMCLPDHVPSLGPATSSHFISDEQKKDHLDTRAECILRSLDGAPRFPTQKGLLGFTIKPAAASRRPVIVSPLG